MTGTIKIVPDKIKLIPVTGVGTLLNLVDVEGNVVMVALTRRQMIELGDAIANMRCYKPGV
jgi:hypothetical protein